jgi:dihydroorotase
VTTIADNITLRRPDDWHLHLRDGAMLRAVLPYTAERFGRAIIMPNLVPPVTTVAAATAYRARILAALPGDLHLDPLMTCYLTDNTDPDELAAGYADRVFAAVKLYPAQATTNSEFGITDFANIHGVLERMERIGMPLLVHGEQADADIDVFDREAVFIERVLKAMTSDHPGLKIVLEHVTTEDGVAFVQSSGPNVAATITPHHLMINRNDIFRGGIRPHLYCLPVAKRERHRLSLRRAATSGDPGFFLGTDSAPHPIADKETACGCAGIFNAPAALECYAQVFDEEGALDRLEGFASVFGPAFYGLAVNEERITIERRAWRVAGAIPVDGDTALHPFRAGEQLEWRIGAS